MEPYDVFPTDEAYPPGLLDFPKRPSLRVRGKLPGGAAIAIVGTRRASEEAAAYAARLAGALTRQGVAVWSGGATGIDAAAHRGALDAGGPTAVVLGSGVLRPWPPENRELFDRVLAEGGALLSAYPDDLTPSPPLFLARNRILAAAVDVLIIVECDVQSGARNASSHARKLGRPVGVVLQAPWASAGKGCFHEFEALAATPLRNEAHALELVRNARLARYGELAPPDAKPPRRKRLQVQMVPIPAVHADERAILRALRDGVTTVDGLCAVTGQPSSQVLAAVLALTVRGVVMQTPQGLQLAPPSAHRHTTPRDEE